MKQIVCRFWLCASLAVLAMLAPLGAKAEDALPLSGIDPAVAAALTACADRLGQPLDALQPLSDTQKVSGAQATTSLTLDDAALPVGDVSALRYLPKLTSLTVVGGTLTDLEGLADHPALQSITLKDCPALDLSPLASCSRLTSVTLAWSEGYKGQATYDLTPLAGCPRLATLTLSGACVDNLAALADMDTLKTLSVEDVAAADFSPVAALHGLTSLRMYGASGEQVALAFSGHSGRLTSAYVGDCTLTAEANAAIFQLARLKSLGFENVEGVDAAEAGWANLTSLTSLTMDGGTLADLAFLKKYLATTVVKLSDIALGESGTRCTVDFDKYFLKLDGVPSEQMVRMLAGDNRQWNYATLRMANGSVSAAVIASLAGVKGLLSLDVQAVATDAFAPESWRGFKTLQQLKLLDCQQADLSVVKVLPALNRIALTNCAVTHETAIAECSRLRGLSLVGCKVADWAFLDGLTCGRNLTTLSIAGCDGPDSFAFAAGLPKLTTLAVEDGRATDLTPVATLTSLSDLYLYGTPIADYTPLTSLTNLQWLGCNEGAALPDLSCRVENRRFVQVP